MILENQIEKKKKLFYCVYQNLTKGGGMKTLSVLSIIMLVLSLSFIVVPDSIAKDQLALKNRLSYLNDTPEVSVVKYIDNQVYIGFNDRPFDIGIIVGAAAAVGSQAYGSMISVWGCVYDGTVSNPEKWKVYNRGKCCAIGRGGQTITNRCQ